MTRWFKVNQIQIIIIIIMKKIYQALSNYRGSAIIFPLNLQTITITRMLSSGG